MAAMAWVVAPVLAGAFADPTAWPKALAASLGSALFDASLEQWLAGPDDVLLVDVLRAMRARLGDLAGS